MAPNKRSSGYRTTLRAAQDGAAATARLLRAVFRAHPGRAAFAAGVVLMGAGVTAYAIAPDTDDPALRPATLLTIPLQTDAAAQAEVLDEQPVVLHDSTQIGRDDTVQTLLGRLGVTDPTTLHTLGRDAQMRALVAGGNIGSEVVAEVDSTGQLRKLEASLVPRVGEFPAPSAGHGAQGEELRVADLAPQGKRLTLAPSAAGWITRLAPLDLRTQTAIAAGEIRGSVAEAAQRAGLAQNVMAQLRQIFAERLNVRHGLLAGEHFAVVYEVFTANGRTVGTGRVLAAELTSHGKRLQALWFAPRDNPGQGGYYTPQGHGLQRGWLTSPLAISKVTSPFGMRFDPVARRTQLHEGVDFHATVGTPVRTVASGRVVAAGKESGYGNVVKIDHPGGFETVYAHLSRIDVHAGQRVSGGQVIAKSGDSGWSTAPHLHFELHVRGRLVDPLKIAAYMPPSPSLPAGERAGFLAATAVLSTQLAAAMGGASRLASAAPAAEID